MVLDGNEAADGIAASATAFAQQLLASKARAQVQPSVSSQHGSDKQTIEAGEQPSSPSRHSLGQGLQLEAHSTDSKSESDEGRNSGSISDDDLAPVVIGDSDDDLELLDRDEEQQLLSRFEDTAVDMEALPDVSPPPSPRQDTQSAQADSSRGKENLAIYTSSAGLLPDSAAHLACAQQEALLGKHGGRGGCSRRPLSAQQGRKHLKRLYGPNSVQDHQPSHNTPAGGSMSDEDPDFLTSELPGAGQSREARMDSLGGKQPPRAAERQDSLGYDSVSADDVSLAEGATGSVGAVRSSMPSQDNSRRGSAAVKKPKQAAWQVLGGLRPDQDSNDSWGCSLPRSSGQMGSASPSTSQHRSYGQVRALLKPCSQHHYVHRRSTGGLLSHRGLDCQSHTYFSAGHCKVHDNKRTAC